MTLKHLDRSYAVKPSDTFYYPVEAPDVDINEPPYVCIQFNKAWLPFVAQAVSRLQYEDCYTGTEAQQIEASQRGMTLYGLFILGGNCGGDTMLRQNPNDACQLQQSNDNGQSWNTVFDFSLCESIKGSGGRPITITIEEIRIIIEELTIIFNTDIDQFYGKVLASNTNTNTVYCIALRMMIDAIIAEAIEALRSNNLQSLISNAGAAIFAAAWESLFTPTWMALATAIAGIIYAGVEYIRTNYSIDDLENLSENEAVLHELQCCAYLQVAGLQIDENDFDGMFDGCIGLSSDAQLFLPILQSVVGDFDTFLLFIASIQEIFPSVEAGLIGNACEDQCEEFCYHFDFGATDGGFSVLERGSWDSGNGWVDGIGNGQSGIFIHRTFDARKFSYFEVTYSASSASAAKLYRIVTRYQGTNQNVPLSTTTDGTNITIFTDPEVAFIADEIIISFTTDDDETPPAGSYAYVHDLEVRGTGINPFGTDNC